MWPAEATESAVVYVLQQKLKHEQLEKIMTFQP